MGRSIYHSVRFAMVLAALALVSACASDQTPSSEHSQSNPQYLGTACSVGQPCQKTSAGDLISVCVSNVDGTGMLTCDPANNVYLASCQLNGQCGQSAPTFANGCSTYLFDPLVGYTVGTSLVCCEGIFLQTVAGCPSFAGDAGVEAAVDAATDVVATDVTDAGSPDVATDAVADAASDVTVDAVSDALAEASADVTVSDAVSDVVSTDVTDAGSPDVATDAVATDATTEAAVDAGPPPANLWCAHVVPSQHFVPTAVMRLHSWRSFGGESYCDLVLSSSGDYQCPMTVLPGTTVTASIETTSNGKPTFPLDVCSYTGAPNCDGRVAFCVDPASMLTFTQGYCEAPGATVTCTFDPNNGDTLSCTGNLVAKF